MQWVWVSSTLVFLGLFITFLILYLHERGTVRAGTVQATTATTTSRLSPPAAASLGTNKKSTAEILFAPPANLEKLATKARAQFRCSRIDYAGDHLGRSPPLLTIVTRSWNRPDRLERCIDTVSHMIHKDFEHVILQDTQGGGMLLAETALYAFRDQFRGAFICHLDDDDRLSNLSLVDDLARVVQSNPNVKAIVYKVWHADQNRVLPLHWHRFPVEGEITTSNLAVHRDTYLEHIRAVARKHAGDYTFLHNVLVGVAHPEEIVWLDGTYFSITSKTPPPPHLVTVELKGGLGNQLFEVATAYAYARDQGKELVMDRSARSVGDRSTYFDSLLKWVKRLEQTPQWTSYQEPGFAYQAIPRLHGHVRLQGYFQSAQYFDRYRNDLRDLIMGSDAKPDRSARHVSLHVRRGDYLNHPLHTVQPLDYYQRALQEVSGRLDSGPLDVHVFSDDLPWCRAHLPRLSVEAEFTFIEDGDEVEQLKAMAGSRHHVIANSSFSWWGAYLSRPEGGSITVAPRQWFNDPSMAWQDVYLPEWTVL